MTVTLAKETRFSQFRYLMFVLRVQFRPPLLPVICFLGAVELTEPPHRPIAALVRSSTGMGLSARASASKEGKSANASTSSHGPASVRGIEPATLEGGREVGDRRIGRRLNRLGRRSCALAQAREAINRRKGSVNGTWMR